MPNMPPTTDFLRRRNGLWLRLRQAEPGTPAFEAHLLELSAMIGWNRARILAGLGLGEPQDGGSVPDEAPVRPD